MQPLPSGGRADLSCGVVRDPTGVAVEVVVVGGAGEFDRLEVDIFDLRTNEWRVGGTKKRSFMRGCVEYVHALSRDHATFPNNA